MPKKELAQRDGGGKKLVHFGGERWT